MSNEIHPFPVAIGGADILIVDDTPANLLLLTEMLKAKGYKVRPVTSGAGALKTAKNKCPDLILLDISMPEMDGFEVCQRLKKDGVLKDIPVLFISALGESADKLNAFNCGGVDYITKPFQSEEVLARVKTHLQIQFQKRSLQRNYDKLRELELLRDNLVHMVVHDMNSPISVINISLFMLSDASNCGFSNSNMKLLKAASASIQQLADMSSQLLAVSRLEAGEMPLDKTECELDLILREAVQSLLISYEGRVIGIDAPPFIRVNCDINIIQRVIVNLLVNALKFTPETGSVTIAITARNGEACVSITDDGPGIPREFHGKIFEKFGQFNATENKRSGSGLGLAFCQLAVEAHGGQIGIDSEPGRGSTFWFTLANL
ncbi:MAG: hybrid sensor histidine kinase/response regulator [Verrucomicrobiota bacterium]